MLLADWIDEEHLQEETIVDWHEQDPVKDANVTFLEQCLSPHHDLIAPI